MSKSLSTITRGIAALALSFAGLTVFAGVAGAAPGVPSSLAATSSATTGAITATWINPATSAVGITSYTITDAAGNVLCTNTAVSIAGASNSCVWTPATKYAGVIHVNANGSDGTTAPDAGTYTLYTLGAPTIGAATPGNGSFSVAFTPSTYNSGGADSTTDPLPATAFQVLYNGTVVASGAASPIVVSNATAGISTGNTAQFTVQAVNPAGTSAASGLSTSATAYTSPSAPTNFTATTDYANGTVDFSWTAPTSIGGGSLSYGIKDQFGNTMTLVGGATATTKTTALSGVTLTTPYQGTFTLTATNTGSLTSTAVSNSIYAASGNPTAPATNVASGTGTSVIATWTAPSSGAPIAYTAQLQTCTSATITTCVNSGSPVVVIGTVLTTTFTVSLGSYYNVAVSAIGVTGSGPSTSFSAAVTSAATASGAPVVTVSSVTNGSITSTYTAPASNGAAITSYTASLARLQTLATTNTATASNSASTVITFTGAGGAPVVGTTITFHGATGSCVVVSSTATTATCVPGASVNANAITSADAYTTVGTAYSDPTPTSHTWTGLTAGVSYGEIVAATNSVGTTLNTFSGKTVNVAPTLSTVTASATGGATTITWVLQAAPITLSSYTVINGLGTVLCTATAPATSCTIPAATAQALYTAGATTASAKAVYVYSTDAAGITSAVSNRTDIGTTLPSNGSIGTPYGNASGVAVNWGAGTNASSYNIVGIGSDGSTITKLGATGTSYVFPASALTAGVTYTFQVMAVNAAGTAAAYTSSSTPAVGLATGTPVANAVAQPTVVGGASGTSLTFSWSAGNSVTGNTVTGYIGTLTSAGSSVTCTTTATSCTFNNLSVPAAYSFTVIAVAPLGNSVASAARTATTSGVPGAVTGLTVTPAAAGTSAVVAWTAPTSYPGWVYGYYVTAQDITAAGAAASCSYSSGLTVTCSGLTAGDTYTFSVNATATLLNGTAGDAAGAASTATVTMNGVPSTPAAPTVTNSGALGVTISWTAPASAAAISNYAVTATTTATNPQTLSCVNAAGTSLTVGTATAATILITAGTATSVTCTFGTAVATTFAVVATSAAGNSISSAASASITPLALPGTPGAGKYTGTNATGYTLGWAASASATATSYTITVSGGPAVLTYSTTNTYYTVPASDLNALFTYTFTVSGVNAAGTGSAFTITAAASAPGAPTALQEFDFGTALAPTTIKLSWTAPTASSANYMPVTAYNVYSNIAGVLTLIGTTASTSLTFNYSATYGAYSVYAVTIAGSSSAATGSTAAQWSYLVAPAVPTISATYAMAVTNASATGFTVNWTNGAPGNSVASSNAVAITGFTVTAVGSDGSSATCTWVSASSCAFTGLNSNVVYAWSVIETTVFGSSIAASGIALTTDVVSAKPTITSVTTTDTTVTMNWTAGTNTGSAVNGFDATMTLNNVVTQCPTALSGSSTSCTWTTSYSPTAFSIKAVNAAGSSPAATTYGAAATATATLKTAAAAPPTFTVTSTVAYPVFGSVKVSWTAATDNASPVTSYTCSAASAGYTTVTATVAAPATSCTVSGLANVAYTFTVTAFNAYNTTGTAGTTQPASVAYGNDTAAVISSVTSTTYGAMTINWSAPVVTANAFDSSPVTSYTVTAVDASGNSFNCGTVAATATSCTITGLSNNTAYNVTVTPNNQAGASSVVSTISATTAKAVVTAAPTGVTAAATTAAGALLVSWTAPIALAQNALTGYTVTAVDASGNAFTCGTVTGTATSCTITGLANKTAYTVTVVGQNGAGSSAASTSVTATTPGAPAAPTAVTAAATTAAGALLVSWTAPTSTLAITGYTVTATPASGAAVTATSTTTSVTLTGLANTATYTITVTATSAAGTSAASTSVTAATNVVPGAPTGVTVAPSFNTTYGDIFTVTWTAPVSNGGSAITGYTIKATNTTTGAATTCTVTSAISALCPALVAGQNFAVTVTANNAIGSSLPAMALSASFGAPTAVTGVTAVRNANGLQISWTPTAGAYGAVASTTEVPVLGYIVSATDQLTGAQFACGVNATYGVVLAPAVTCNIAGLTVGSNYTVSVQAANLLSGLSPAARVSALYASLTPEPVMATFLAVTAKQKSVSALSPASKTALAGLISTINDGASITITGYGTTMAIAQARAIAAASYLFNNGAAVHITIKTVISKTVKTALVTVTVN